LRLWPQTLVGVFDVVGFEDRKGANSEELPGSFDENAD
jgi:hypothetical protein